MRITKALAFDYGHRLRGHEGKCRHYHGHRGLVMVMCEADKLDGVGRVIDFSVIKTAVGGWLDADWDHGMLLEEGDPMLPMLRDMEMKHEVLAVPPTAENLSRLVFERATNLLSLRGVRVTKVVFYETPTSSAEYP